MPTTTIRLPPRLKSRVVAAARRTGTTPHSFILEAIVEKTDEAERRSDFHRIAEERYARIAATGKTIPWSKMRRYLEGRVGGKKARRPVASTLRRG